MDFVNYGLEFEKEEGIGATGHYSNILGAVTETSPDGFSGSTSLQC
jgi:hypothetical protein